MAPHLVKHTERPSLKTFTLETLFFYQGYKLLSSYIIMILYWLYSWYFSNHFDFWL